ncbi:hypothetical protein AX14_011743 [Amanita brunnescens Koide BX004]|nr:hypothetical protein AX14_011743 [Amanita brunnescens Koide BX004]
MIITPQNTGMTQKHNKPTQADEPPPYDFGLPSTSHDEPPPFVAVEERQPLITTTPAYGTEPPRIYQYSNLLSDEQVASLPPGHPQMACVQAGMHDLHTTFGLLGILAAVFWFPIGIGCCLLDRRSTCRRCGAVLSTGFCD